VFGLRAGRPRNCDQFRAGARISFLSKACKPVLGPTQPLIHWVAGVKRLWREPDHTPPLPTEVKNEWCCTSTRLCALVARARTTLPITHHIRVRFPMGPLGFFVDLILPAVLWPWGRLSL
jgi:hypothetical protein